MQNFKLDKSDWDRFWEKVNMDEPHSCWEWVGATNSDGYGVFWQGEKLVGPHQIMWSVSNNAPIPGDKDIAHTCDNPSCINSEHLFLATRSENMLDARAKGRIQGKTYAKIECPICSKEFVRDLRQTHLKREDREHSYCSRSCSAIASNLDNCEIGEQSVEILDYSQVE